MKCTLGFPGRCGNRKCSKIIFLGQVEMVILDMCLPSALVWGTQVIIQTCLNAALELPFCEAQACESCPAIHHITLHLVEALQGNRFSVSQEVPPLRITSQSPCSPRPLYFFVACTLGPACSYVWTRGPHPVKNLDGYSSNQKYQ